MLLFSYVFMGKKSYGKGFKGGNCCGMGRERKVKEGEGKEVLRDGVTLRPFQKFQLDVP